LCLKSARNIGIKSSYPSHPQKIKKIKIEVRSGAMINNNRKEIGKGDTRNINSAYGGPLWSVESQSFWPQPKLMGFGIFPLLHPTNYGP
jgi:hypothetical protein